MAKKYLSSKQWKKVYKKSEKDAVNTFEIEFFAVMNNSIQGKKVKYIRNIVNIRLITDAEKFENLLSKSQYLNQRFSCKSKG